MNSDLGNYLLRVFIGMLLGAAITMAIHTQSYSVSVRTLMDQGKLTIVGENLWYLSSNQALTEKELESLASLQGIYYIHVVTTSEWPNE